MTSKNRFQPGDKVKLTDASLRRSLKMGIPWYEGNRGVVQIADFDNVEVLWDRPVNRLGGHSGVHKPTHLIRI